MVTSIAYKQTRCVAFDSFISSSFLSSLPSSHCFLPTSWCWVWPLWSFVGLPLLLQCHRSCPMMVAHTTHQTANLLRGGDIFMGLWCFFPFSHTARCVWSLADAHGQCQELAPLAVHICWEMRGARFSC